MPKNSKNYDKDSQAFEAQVQSRREKASAEVFAIIEKGGKAAATRLVKLITSKRQDISLAASKHTLKLMGLEVERHGGADGGDLTIHVKRYE